MLLPAASYVTDEELAGILKVADIERLGTKYPPLAMKTALEKIALPIDFAKLARAADIVQ